MWRTCAAAIAAVVAAAGCDSTEPRGPRVAPSPSASPYLYVCGNTVFDPAVFEAGGIEGDDPELRELVESLNRTRRETVGGWHVVSDDGGRVSALARIPGGYVSQTVRYSFVSASFERDGDRWTPDNFGECQPEVVISGRRRVIWELAVEPSPSDTELVVMAIEPACSSDRKLTQKNTRFDVEYSAEAIAVIGTVAPPIGGNCVDATPRRLTVRLDEPVGDRSLFDAAVYPPERRYPCARRGSRIPGPLVCSQLVPAS